MNLTKAITVVAVVSFVFVGCKNNSETTKTGMIETETTSIKSKQDPSNNEKPRDIASANLQTASFKVEGMTCAIGCATTIQEELSALEGVQTATVDFDKKRATVTYDKTVQNPESLSTTVQATGDGKTYKVSNMKS